MSTDQPAPVSKAALWAGRVMSGLPALMMLAAVAMTFLKPEAGAEGLKKYGYPEGVQVPLAIVQLVCTVLYLIPRTSVLGAILLTGFLGGAVATHVRAGEPSWFIAVIFGVLFWGGLFLRDPRVRALIPLRR